MDIILHYIAHNKLGDLFLDKPSEFHKEARYIMANPEPDRQAFFARPWASKDPAKTWVLLGTLAAILQSGRMAPMQSKALAFQSNSANGSFVVYKNREGAAVFIKISTSATDDRLECDSVILRALHKNAGISASVKAHFSVPLMSSQLLVSRNVSISGATSYALEFGDLMNNYYGNTYNGVNAFPCFATTAAVPGFSLGAIIDALGTRRGGGSDDKLMTFFQSGVPNANAPGPYLNAMRHRLLRKLDEFTSAMIHTGVKTYLAHGDLHTGNVIYDMYADALVAIDFGRSYIYTARDTMLVQEEHAKLQSAVRRGNIIDGPEFFKTFGSAYMRDPTRGNARMLQYNIMNDIAGLHFIVWSALRELQGPLFEELRVPFLDVQYTAGNDKVLLVEAIQGIQGIQDGLGQYVSDDMEWPGLLWFAFMIRALINEGLVSYAMYYDDDFDRVYHAVDYDQVFGKTAPFYFAGQITPDAYYAITESLQESLREAGFFKAVQKWSEKVMSGSQSGGFVMGIPDASARARMPNDGKEGIHMRFTQPYDGKPRKPSRRVYTDKEIMDNYVEHRQAAARDTIANAKPHTAPHMHRVSKAIPVRGLSGKPRQS